MTHQATIYSSKAAVDEAHAVLFKTFATGRTKSLAWRQWQLKQLWWLLDENTDRILEALKADLNRHPVEGMASDITSLKKDILLHLQNLDAWTSTSPVDAGFLQARLFKARLRKEPLGVTLIIGAWNFPFLLLLQPLVAAIAAGCCALLKPSELSASCERLLTELVPKYLDPSAIRIVTGGPSETGYILEKRFNHIFFTGSSNVARFIAAAAAKNLTPTVLELGGQGPAIVTSSADVDFAARRIANAKFTNAGQICLSVNHVFVDPTVVDLFVDRVKHYTSEFVRGEGKDHMCRIINNRNLDRLKALLDKTKGKVVIGGTTDAKTRFFHPTVVANVKLDDALLSEELFGPILPIIKANLQEAVAAINAMPTPLAIYLFAKDRAVIDDVLDRTLSGGVTVNNVFFHAGFGNAPFGGVGESGYGAYHGPHGIDCFSHKRTVVEPPQWIDKLMGFTYAPYDESNISKLHVKNKLGFRKGETMEDQRVGGRGLVSWTSALSVAAVVFAIYAGREHLLKVD